LLPDAVAGATWTVPVPYRLTARELDILNGMARQIKWTAEGGAATLAQKRSLGKRLR